MTALTRALEPTGLGKLAKTLKRPLKNVKASAKVAGIAEGSLEAELRGSEADVTPRITELIRGFDRPTRRMLLVLDEAQVLAEPAHSDLAHSLRASLDGRKQNIKVVFAGSSEATLRRMFGRSTEPFYNWAPLEAFPLLGDEFVAFTIKLMNSMARQVLTLKQGKRAFDELHRTPEFFKRFVERYMLYQPQGEEAALAHTKASVFSDEHFLKQWTEMNPADQAVITMLARGESDLHAKEGMAKLSVMLGKPATRNTAGHALRRLQSENAVTRLALGDYRIEDEAFAEWIRRRTAPKH